jgi:arsenate reductase (glutaredoxin)
MDKIIIYGIPNCDITKKALKWLKDHKIDFSFHDYKKEGITNRKLEEWCTQVGWETLLNKKSTTWRSLTEAEQAGATTRQAAIKIMIDNNSIIKRPVIQSGDKLLVGFDEENYSKQLK